mgnify:CR=1 FL=1
MQDARTPDPEEGRRQRVNLIAGVFLVCLIALPPVVLASIRFQRESKQDLKVISCECDGFLNPRPCATEIGELVFRLAQRPG